MKRNLQNMLVSAFSLALVTGVVTASDYQKEDAVVNRKVGVNKKLGTVECPVESDARTLPAGSKFEREIARLKGADKSESPFSATIAVEGMGESVTYFQENFNTGAIPAGWEIAPSDNVTWKVTKPSGNYIFTEDPDDGGSLIQDTPYQVFKREKSWAVSPEFTPGRNTLLELWVGCSLNWEDNCSLKVQVSADNFETVTDLWFSREATGEKPWQWRKVQASLADFAGKSVKLRFFYGSGTADDIFDAGGYGGDYRIDNIRVYGPGSVEKVNLTTGEKVRFIAASDAPDDAVYAWSFPGGVPESSSEANPEVYYTADGDYDVTLSVTSGEETASETREGLVHVTGTEPTAIIGYPATFRRNESGRKIMVAPTVPVKFTDASAGYPTEWSWAFSGTDEDSENISFFDTRDAEVSYKYLHEWPLSMSASNIHGNSMASGSVVAEYEGTITNMQPDETGTNFDLDGYGTFPGSNTFKISAYAERFSAPSRPMRVYGAYVFFTKAEASSAYYQIQNVKVSVCKAGADGLPGEVLDWASWAVFELDLPQGNIARGTGFEFTEAPVIDSDFFIVIEGIPELVDNAEDKCDVRMAMAPFRTQGNSALLKRDGKWVEASSYFPAPANHTSYMVMVDMAHSVICNLPGTDNIYTVPAQAGETTLALYSWLGWKKELSSTDVPWIHIAAEPGGMTLDNVKISYEASSETSPREGHVTFSDGVSTHTFTVIQSGVTSIETTGIDGEVLSYDYATDILTAEAGGTVYNVYGAKVATFPQGVSSLVSLAPGVYIARSGTATLKFVK